MNLRPYYRWLAGAMLVMTITGCSNAAATPTPAPAEVAEPTSQPQSGYPIATVAPAGYPAPGTVPSGYPAPANAPVSSPYVVEGALPIPAPASDAVGVVHGQLMNKSSGTAVPLFELNLYLGIVVEATDGSEAAVRLDKGISPQALFDREGNFAFSDVPPGRYGLMLDTPYGAVLLNNPENGEAFVIEVTGGKTSDLGSLVYDLTGTI